MINGVDLGECRSLCESFPAFFFMELNVDPSSYCECCETTDTGELAVDPRFITAATYEVVRGDPGTLQDLCSGENCVCDDINRDTQTFNLDSTQCANVCYLQDPPLLTFSIITFNGPEPYFDPRTGSNFLVSSVCICCNGPATEAYEFPEEGVAQTWTITPFPAGAQGDPHITTLDGRHYTLMKQGIFSLWHLSGLSTQFRSENGEVKTVPVDWQIYTRYSGQQAFTKGVLLVDKSGGSVRQVMEMTSQDCQWRARKADTEWTMVKDDEVISVPDSQDYVTGFQVTTKRGTKGYNRVHLSVNTRGGKMDKAVLSLSCRAHHHINLQLVMRQRDDYRFVDGELKVARGLSTLQTDTEFAIHTKWEDLGGSQPAAKYLEMDQAVFGGIALWQSCSREDEVQAQEMCSKHLGEIQHGADETFYTDCVFDVCHGAGETAAELAAELLESTRAIEGV